MPLEQEKKYSGFLTFSFPAVGIFVLYASPFLRMLGTTIFCFSLAGFVTRDALGKKLLTFLSYYTAQIFSESVVSIILVKLRPEIGPGEITRLEQHGPFEKIINYNYYQSAFVYLILLITFIIMRLIYHLFWTKQKEENNLALRPFLFLGVVQFVFAFFTTYFINMFIRVSYVYLILLAAQSLMLVMLLWIVWQCSLTEKRLRVEKELNAIRQKGEMDARLYGEMREKILEIGKFRHDFFNQLQIVDYLLERRDLESLEKAENIIKELLIKMGPENESKTLA